MTITIRLTTNQARALRIAATIGAENDSGGLIPSDEDVRDAVKILRDAISIAEAEPVKPKEPKTAEVLATSLLPGDVFAVEIDSVLGPFHQVNATMVPHPELAPRGSAIEVRLADGMSVFFGADAKVRKVRK